MSTFEALYLTVQAATLLTVFGLTPLLLPSRCSPRGGTTDD
jgi:hypothetical protein